jgi:hypothetical protein
VSPVKYELGFYIPDGDVLRKPQNLRGALAIRSSDSWFEFLSEHFCMVWKEGRREGGRKRERERERGNSKERMKVQKDK